MIAWIFLTLSHMLSLARKETRRWLLSLNQRIAIRNVLT